MDTDSFVLSIRTENFVKNLKTLADMFDFSNLGTKHELFSKKKTKIVIEKFKKKHLRMFG